MNLRLAAVVLVLAGCASTSVPPEAHAVRDFVVVSDLQQVNHIRLYRPLRYYYVNDYFVTVVVGDRSYLVEFAARCRALRSKTYTASMVDFRKDPSYLREKDTIRGCPVQSIFEATVKQLVEIGELSKSTASQNAATGENT